MLLKFVLTVASFCAGLIIAMGVFSVLIAIGLVPRFAGKTDTANHILMYENIIVIGIILGTFSSIFFEFVSLPSWLSSQPLWHYFCQTLFALYGCFTGIFVGCLAVAIAEMLDAIPIFARRISFEKGIGIAILFVALGKLVGSLLYYYNAIFVAANM